MVPESWVLEYNTLGFTLTVILHINMEISLGRHIIFAYNGMPSIWDELFTGISN
jgi:hypothetical protein